MEWSERGNGEPVREEGKARRAEGGETRRGVRRCSGQGAGGHFGAGEVGQAHGLEAEGVFAFRDHGQRDGDAVRLGVHVFGLEPGAETRIVDLRMAVPEAGVEAALNLQVVQLQLNDGDAFGKIAADIVHADMEASDFVAFALCFDDHRCLQFPEKLKQV